MLEIKNLVKTYGNGPRAVDGLTLTVEKGDIYGFIGHNDAGVFVVEGGDVERILDTTDPEDDVSMRRFQQLLIKTGIIQALREMGAKDGDTIRLGEWEFDFTD